MLKVAKRAWVVLVIVLVVIVAAFCVDRFRGFFGRTELTGYQASRRGGFVHVRVVGDRVMLGGHAITVLRGELLV